MTRPIPYGTQTGCTRCGQDIEYHGRSHGWIDRGWNRECAVYEDRKTREFVRPKGLKHRTYRNWE